MSDKCASSDASGACLSCFKGYDLANGACSFSASNTAAPSDLGCGTWDWNNQVCLACSKNFVFNANGVCVPVSDQCKSSSSSTGACLTCFKGYDLVNGACEFSSFNTAAPSDLGCASWNWDSQVCLQCSNKWVFNANGICVPVSDSCSTNDQTGACTGCFAGYILANGACKLGNPLCKSSTSTGACSTCYTGYVLVNSSCTPISKLASLYLYYSECCP